MAGPSVLLAYIIGGIAAYSLCVRWGKCRYITRQPALSRLCAGKPRPAGRLHYRLDLLLEILIVAIADVTAFGIYMGVGSRRCRTGFGY